MGVMTARVGRLERCRTVGHRFTPDDCPGGPTALAVDGEAPPADAAACRLCGVPHLLVLVEQVVPAPAPATSNGEAR